MSRPITGSENRMPDTPGPRQEANRPWLDEESWRRMDRAIRNVADRCLADDDQKDDLISEVWVKIIEHHRELKDPAKAPAWAASIARHIFADWTRQREREARSVERSGLDPTMRIPTECSLTEDEMTDPMDWMDRIVLAVNDLKGLKKPIVILKYWSNLTFKEIADLLGVSVDTVEYLHRRAKGELLALRDKTLPKPGMRQAQYPESIQRRIIQLRELADAAVDKLELVILMQQKCCSVPVPEEWVLRVKIFKAHIRFAFSCLQAGIARGGDHLIIVVMQRRRRGSGASFPRSRQKYLKKVPSGNYVLWRFQRLFSRDGE
jgi:RNA polymerase sigma factor (sigma-70 family)